MYEIEVVLENEIDERPDNYNTACHCISEHPSHEAESRKDFDVSATTFDKWMPLILKSRNIANDSRTITLPGYIVDDLIVAVRCYKTLGKINERCIKDLMEEGCFKALGIFDGQRKWFCRCDDVSPKDGINADKPLKTVSDLLRVLTTSWRMHGAYARYSGGGFRLHFLPWDFEADTMNEFRIFVPPTHSIEEAKISAVSQYSWWRPITSEIEAKIPNVIKSSERILESIKANENAESLKQGFSFDVQCRGSEVQLIELNGFGALQATGACLFNWVSDRHILYDEDDIDKIIVRICKKSN